MMISLSLTNELAAYPLASVSESSKRLGTKRFSRFWELSEKASDIELSQADLVQMHKTIKKVGDDLNNFQFNTAVAALMTWLNYLSAKDTIGKQEYATLLRLLAPFAPHIAEELYHLISLSVNSIHLENWPSYQAKYLVNEMASIVVQVNGKLRDTIQVQRGIIKERKEIEEAAKHAPKASKYIEGQQIRKVIYIEGKLINFVVG